MDILEYIADFLINIKNEEWLNSEWDKCSIKPPSYDNMTVKEQSYYIDNTIFKLNYLLDNITYTLKSWSLWWHNAFKKASKKDYDGFIVFQLFVLPNKPIPVWKCLANRFYEVTKKVQL